MGGDGSREVTITIGAANAYDDPDIAVNLSDTAGHITVRRGLFGFTGSVTLTNLTDDTQGVWLDTAGGFGGITVKELAQNYQAFQKKAAESGATVDLHLAYIDADESRKALVLNQVQISVDADGNYVLTGGLAPDPEIELTEVDAWDVTGKAFQAYFDAFRKTYNLDPGQLSKFKTVELDFTGADLYLDTITPLSYSQAGLYAQDSESRAAGTLRRPRQPRPRRRSLRRRPPRRMHPSSRPAHRCPRSTSLCRWGSRCTSAARTARSRCGTPEVPRNRCWLDCRKPGRPRGAGRTKPTARRSR